jgi:hypothetical protein
MAARSKWWSRPAPAWLVAWNRKWLEPFRLVLLVECCVLLVATAAVLALDGLVWMALGQLITLSVLLEYAHKARKARS